MKDNLVRCIEIQKNIGSIDKNISAQGDLLIFSPDKRRRLKKSINQYKFSVLVISI